MINSEVESNYLEYVDNIKNGRYIIPPVLIIYDALCNRYGEERVDASNLGRVSNITLTNLASRESFNSICEFYSLDYTDIDVDNDNFIIILYAYINTAFIIKYPFITISNSKREYHTIRDLYVKFEFTSEGRMRETFSMQRSTYSLKEFLYSYKHSHVGAMLISSGRRPSRNSIREFSSVCLGTGPIRDIITGLSVPYSEEGFNEIAFMQFLNLLDDFVAWESLEGVPYRHLADIPKQNIDNLAIVPEGDLQLYTTSYERERIINTILQEDVLDKIQEYLYTIPKVFNGLPYIVVKCDEYALQKYLITLVDNIPHSLISNSEVIYKKDDFGRITYFRKSRYTIDRELLKESLNEVQNTNLFTFKGEVIKLNIEGLEVLDNVDSEESYEYFLHPQFISDIIKYTEIIINSKYATQTKLYEPSTL